MRLKFYEKEKSEFREFNKKMKVTNREAIRITLKLARHFKIEVLSIRFKRGNWNYAYSRLRAIKFGDKTTIGVICHELAHLWNYQRYRNSKHNKKLYSAIKRLIRYCRKMNYWKAELERLKQNPLTEREQRKLIWKGKGATRKWF